MSEKSKSEHKCDQYHKNNIEDDISKYHCNCNCTCSDSISSPKLSKSATTSCECNRNKPNSAVKRTDIGYLMHLKNMKNIKAVINNKPPVLFVDNILRSGKIIDDFLRLRKITQQNQDLLSRINVIYRTRGVIDTYNKMAGVRFSNIPAKLEEIKRYEKQNVKMIYRLINTPSVIINSKLEASWQKHLAAIRIKSKYPLILPGLEDTGTDMMESNDSLTSFLISSRPRVFIDFSVKNGRLLGRLVISLFSDIVPITCKNFYNLCSNYRKQNRAEMEGNNQKYPNYVGSLIHRIFPKLYIEAGDITSDCGIGGISADGGEFFEDNFEIEHKYTGIVAMIPTKDGNFTSQFTISFKPLPIMNENRMVFGRVIRGINVLKTLEGCGTSHGKPKEKVIISNTGVIPAKQLRPICLCKK